MEVGDCLSITPKEINFGVISSGFIYTLNFSIRNNLLVPIRIKIALTPQEGELNLIRLLYIPDKIAPGMATDITLELIADFPNTSIFVVNISQSHNSDVFTRVIEAHVVTIETFKHVKKSLELQKRPVFASNVRQVGSSAAMNEVHSSVASSDHLLLMDDDDIDDITSFPQAPNVYWDPFSKVLRIDPILGQVLIITAVISSGDLLRIIVFNLHVGLKVVVDTKISLEESKSSTKALRCVILLALFFFPLLASKRLTSSLCVTANSALLT
jgi:hypothetical protein